jgi:hypothetical protein
MARGSIVALMVLSMACVPASPQGKAFVWKPEVISLRVGGAFGPSYEVTYDRRELRYYAAKNMFGLRDAKPVVIRPTDAQWDAFFSELDRLDVWGWKRRYEDPQIADGTSWRAVIVYSTQQPRALVSSGSNAYPANFGAFRQAVRKLIGDRKFE